MDKSNSVRSDVELLRIISAFGIVWFHSGFPVGRDIAYAGLIVFLILSAYFTVRSNRTHSIGERASRLLLPCIFWSVVYAAFSIAKGKDVFPDDYSILRSMLATPSIHLWYLPFIFFCTIAVDFTKARIHPVTLAVFAILIASAFLLTSPLWRQWPYVSPFSQYLHAAPAIFVGMLYGLSGKLSQKMKYLSIGLLLMSTIFAFQLNAKGVGINYLIGVTVTLLLLTERSILPKNHVILVVSKLTFGVYLIHPIFLSLLGYFGVDSLNLIVLSFVASLIGVYFLFRLLPRPASKYII